MHNTADLAAFYLAASASAKLITKLELPAGYSVELRMSDNFRRKRPRFEMRRMWSNFTEEASMKG